MGPTSGGDAALMCLSSIRSRFVRRSPLRRLAAAFLFGRIPGHTSQARFRRMSAELNSREPT
jgi:hypothetical protein